MKVTEKQYADQTESLSKNKSAKKSAAGQAPSKAVGTFQPKDTSDVEVSSAKVNLSDRALDMKKIKDQINSSPDVDEAKVAKYKSMLAKGEYKVDSRAVADKMVDEHLRSEFFAATNKDE